MARQFVSYSLDSGPTISLCLDIVSTISCRFHLAKLHRPVESSPGELVAVAFADVLSASRCVELVARARIA
jgi:hypothetical protein